MEHDLDVNIVYYSVRYVYKINEFLRIIGHFREGKMQLSVFFVVFAFCLNNVNLSVGNIVFIGIGGNGV